MDRSLDGEEEESRLRAIAAGAVFSGGTLLSRLGRTTDLDTGRGVDWPDLVLLRDLVLLTSAGAVPLGEAFAAGAV